MAIDYLFALGRVSIKIALLLFDRLLGSDRRVTSKDRLIATKTEIKAAIILKKQQGRELTKLSSPII